MGDLTDQDSMAKLEEMLQNVGEGGQMPSRKDILEMLDGAELDDELKENLKALLNFGAPQIFGGYGTGLGITFVLVIFSILFFFGYKLYKSIKEKELRREEKKKLKQMKKKK